MFENVINSCKKFNNCMEHRSKMSKDEMDFVSCFNLELATSIIKDANSINAKKIAKIILCSLGE